MCGSLCRCRMRHSALIICMQPCALQVQGRAVSCDDKQSRVVSSCGSTVPAHENHTCMRVQQLDKPCCSTGGVEGMRRQFARLLQEPEAACRDAQMHDAATSQRTHGHTHTPLPIEAGLPAPHHGGGGRYMMYLNLYAWYYYISSNIGNATLVMQH